MGNHVDEKFKGFPSHMFFFKSNDSFLFFYKFMPSMPSGKCEDSVQHIRVLRAIPASVSYLSSIFKLWQKKGLCQLIMGDVFSFRTSEHINANQRSIEFELKELLKLCRWERTDIYLTIENSKRTRQKFRKLIQKYNVSDTFPFQVEFIKIKCWTISIQSSPEAISKYQV